MAQIKQQYYVLYCNANICKGAFYNARVAKIEKWIMGLVVETLLLLHLGKNVNDKWFV